MDQQALDIIEKTIKEVVNGKIDRLTVEVKGIKEDMTDFHVKVDRKNKEQDEDRADIKKGVDDIKRDMGEMFKVMKGFKILGDALGIVGEGIDWLAGRLKNIAIIVVFATALVTAFIKYFIYK